jgi:hypothetical protein
MTSLDLLRRTRWMALATLFAFTSSSLTACAPMEGELAGEDAPEEFIEEVTDVSHTAVKRQSIGNCWIYATVGWVESLHRAKTGRDLNISESYITYWDWFAKITSGSGIETSNGRASISTGGWWDAATNIMRARGVVMEADFIPEEANTEISQRQAAAESAINAALNEGGELATAEARRNPETVLRVLNRAWNLSPTVVATLQRVFGTRGERRLDSYSSTGRANPTASFVRKPADIAIRTSFRSSSGTIQTVDGTLQDVIPGGRYAWQSASYPASYDTRGRQEFMRRLLRALNQDQPVVISWLVDFNGLDNTGAFRLDELQRRGVGRQGGHLTVLEDYQVTLRDGRVLAAGTNASAADRELALNGTVQFLRIKNSWGTYRTDRASMAGYYDLYMNYLNGPITWQGEGTGSTSQRTPLSSIVLPPGF